MNIEIPKFEFPAEEVLQFIEGNRKISITRDAFASREYYNPHHREGRDTPAYYANSGKGDGIPILLVDISGINHVVLYSSKAQKDPIKISKPGRSREQR